MITNLLDGLYVHAAGSNVGILRHADSALLINAGNPGLGAVLHELGIRTVERVLFTHHRRELADGLGEVQAAFRPRIAVPQAERELFAAPGRYWDDPKSRWYGLCNHVPYHVTHVAPIPVSEELCEGQVIEWHDWRITVLATRGYTDGAVSLVARRGDRSAAFTGDLIYAPGQIRDLYCLQRANEENGHKVGDYHGFMGAMRPLLASLERVTAEEPELLVPAHGTVMDRPGDAVRLLASRLTNAYQNYVEVSALRWYFPKYFASHSQTAVTLTQQPAYPLPDHVRVVQGTCWALVSASKRALLLDPCSDGAIAAAKALVDKGEIVAFDGAWITHYHCDHLEGAESARRELKCPVITDHGMADIVANPGAYFLTCLANRPSTVDRPTADGETWRWENFTLTAYHFPGQSYYHSGLLAVADDGARYFFAGDAVTPMGIDDYCAWNRNFLGADVGFRYCMRLLRRLQPTLVFNPHVAVGFTFTESAYDLIDRNLAERERLFAALLPWDHPDFGTDECWVHTYPYEQDASPGATIRLDVRVRNHADVARDVDAFVLVPEGWAANPARLGAKSAGRDEVRLRFEIVVPKRVASGRVVIPVRVRFGDLDLGSFREAIVRVGAGNEGQGSRGEWQARGEGGIPGTLNPEHPGLRFSV
ncbi:MAG: hypothetical protein A3K19_05120 [Lentisphaerae bacterium RIFOXYB12_FULL_65_16]|nr:MAG: hypothetical protein A3K18_35230 [Lentisphaerae bacterium RIFOXYA12_64_32]OGV89769.1 MAG: hypothetical protein A3K19_05120 [Lentisphaerae bacterium RIFOXYB12_FULL_65_16]